jgi:2-dehydropantoate 2-reductase
VESYRIAVMGAGAIGSLVGGLLAKAGNDVTLIGRRTHMEAIEKNGLRISGLENFTTHPAALTKPRKADIYLLTVKTYDVATAISMLPHDNSPVVGFQNGMGSLDEIERQRPDGVTLGAVCYLGATFLEPGEVRYAGRGQMYFGDYGSDGSEHATLIADMFASAGLDATSTTDLRGMLWEKLLVNAGINPLTALTGLPNGAITEDSILGELMLGAVREGEEVASAEGIKLTNDIGSLALEVCRKTSGNRSSMLQDIERGRRTEVDAINGYIVEKAKFYNTPVQVNTALYALVKGRERSGLDK